MKEFHQRARRLRARPVFDDDYVKYYLKLTGMFFMENEVSVKPFSDIFDKYFENQAGLKWFPWVGRDFDNLSVRTMFLGESVYDWSPKKENCRNRYKQKNALRLTHANHALKFERASAYVRNIERAVFYEANPSKEKKRCLWQSVVYHNLVLDLLPSKKHRPTLDQYLAGWRETVPLCQTLGVNECVVYGVEWPKRQALNQVLEEFGLIFKWKSKIVINSKSKARILKCIFHNGNEIKFVFIRHPSAFFSWRNWGALLSQELNLLPTLIANSGSEQPISH